MPPVPEDEDLPRLLSGRYRLEGTLGQGGMGVVYRGTDLMMKRPIAVKLIRSVDGVELDDEIAGRFLREAKNTARIQHEHIIEVFDLGRSDGGGMYFVMELLEGESLSARIKRVGAMPAAKVVHIGRQICEALQVAHTAGVIHRDLKPANVMLLRRAGLDDYVKVLDFGVAKSVGGGDHDQTQLTHTGMLVGTVDYMAPEQIMGKVVDGRTDVYALGVVLYKMLCGKAPFRDAGVPALIHAHLNTMPQPLIEAPIVGKNIPNELDRVVLRCLAKNPDRRYESMAELGRALGMSIAPDSESAMLSLEYKPSAAAADSQPSSDPYAADDMTAIGRSYADSPPAPGIPAAPKAKSSPSNPAAAAAAAASSRFDQAVVDDDSTFNENPFDDATIRIDRPLDLPKRRNPPSPGGGLPMTPRALSNLRDMGSPPRVPIPSPSAGARPPISRSSQYPEDVSTAKRQIPDEITRIDRTEPKPCAMCQTMNAPHARACAACGVSLAVDEQDAVRARVRSAPPPRTASTPAPPMAPPVSVRPLGVGSGSNPFAQVQLPPPPPSSQHPHHLPYPQQHQQQQPPQMYPTPSPMHGVPAAMQQQSWHPHQQPPQQQQQPSSAWKRFLKWTGLG